MERTWELSTLVQAVREVAAASPDFRYVRKDYPNHSGVCVYTDPDGEPSCIIGRALAKIGDPVPAWDVEKHYNSCLDREIAMINSEPWYTYMRGNELTNEEERMLSWLGVVQSQQDYGTSWGKAVQQADNAYPLV